MANPTVSVIVCCYNLGEFLGEAVASVLTQTFHDFDVLVVDDGSTDPLTQQVLAEIEQPSVRVLRSENRGLAAAKNLGLANTSGRYVCMVDADDRLDPTLLQKSVAALDRDESLAFVSHWLRAFGDETWDWTPTTCELPALLDVNTVNGAALVRRAAVEAVGGFDESFVDGCEDWDLWIGLVERGFRGAIIPEFLFQYRRRATSMSRLMMKGDTHPRLYRRLVEKHLDSYRDHLGSLLLRREEDACNLRLHAHDLELEYEHALEPELMQRRDEAATLRKKLALWKKERALEDERSRLRLGLQEASAHADLSQAVGQATLEEARAQCERLREELAASERALAGARGRALQLDAAANQARYELADIRASMSWRFTAPLRALYGEFLRLKQPHEEKK
jgi:glycosyltransferase involved in cell wall biosynthesis